MELLEKVKSNEDKTVKYVFELNGQIVEFSYIDNNTGKDIICVPCQTMCNQSCKFCHLTDLVGKISLKNLTKHQIIEGIDYIINDMSLGDELRPLLISYMGSGEPLANIDEVYSSMVILHGEYANIRFGLATILPKAHCFEFFEFTKRIKDSKLNVKVHLSLHYTNDKQRNQDMPSALNIKASIAALEFYKEATGNSVEIHYTLIKDVNDEIKDGAWLIVLLENRDIPVKFLRFNPKKSNNDEGTEIKRIQQFRNLLEASEIKSEYYEPPGRDCGSSCGIFLIDKYEKHSQIKTV